MDGQVEEDRPAALAGLVGTAADAAREYPFVDAQCCEGVEAWGVSRAARLGEQPRVVSALAACVCGYPAAFPHLFVAGVADSGS